MKKYHSVAISGEAVFIWCICGKHLEMSAFQPPITCPDCKKKYSVEVTYIVWQLEPDEKEREE